MKRIFLLSIISLSFCYKGISQQNEIKTQQLLKQAEQLNQKHIQDQQKAKQLGIPLVEILPDGTVLGFKGFDQNNRPEFYKTDNVDAAITTRTNEVQIGGSGGYNLTGSTIQIGEWDGGEVLNTHQELTGRVVQQDSPSSVSNHATHVAGTMIASGIDPNAKGMATQANIRAYDFFNDESEMAIYAADTSSVVSNHSYGAIAGWNFHDNSGEWRWYGDSTISTTEDYNFGRYSFSAREWDVIAKSNPNYLIVKSAGNDRNDSPPAGIASHQEWDNVSGGWVTVTTVRPADCSSGYDCISTSGNAKNILTVGAVADISGGYSQPSDVIMSSFSGWGPTDDGRIKPDIVANGVGLYSSGSDNNTDYTNSSGTSMSAPNATGSLALVQQYYRNTYGSFAKAATIKGLAIHKAEETGSDPGPDYAFGWGLLNTRAMIDFLADTTVNSFAEESLNNGATNTYSYTSNGTTPFEVTICWTDIAGSISSTHDDLSARLINDLDVRITSPSGTLFMPWTLSPIVPSAAATTGDNILDNVEKIQIPNPVPGNYMVTVSHKGTLQGGSQQFSLLVSGKSVAASTPPTALFTASQTNLCQGDSVLFTDISVDAPTTWLWNFPGGTPNTSTSNTPGYVTYNTAGVFDASLIVENAAGADTITFTNFITAQASGTPVLNVPDTVCQNAASIPLTASITGGTFAGPGISGSNFDPATAGLGSHTIQYNFPSGSCATSTTKTVVVVPPPAAPAAPLIPPICSNSSAVLLPNTYTYSGPGISGNSFDPAVAGVGSHTIQYTFTNSIGCAVTGAFSITVFGTGTTTLTPFNDVCIGAGVINLTGGSPAGGFYSGTGIDSANATFNPQVAGIGAHTITYTAMGSLCFATASSTITVLASQPVSHSAVPSICIQGGVISLSGGIPVNGTYSGPGITGNTFDPQIAGIGIHTITYDVTGTGGNCSGSTTFTIEVTNSISVSFPDPSNAFCENSPPFTITTGQPGGGNYSGPGVSNNVFNPSAAGPGTWPIVYTLTQNGCTGSDTAQFTVMPSPSVALKPFPPVCKSLDTFMLTGGTPVGGVYSGLFVTDSVFTPNTAGIGSFTITYTITNILGCQGIASQSIQVDSTTLSMVNLNNGYCNGEAPINLDGLPLGGMFIGDGVYNDTLYIDSLSTGQYQVGYTGIVTCPDTLWQAYEVYPNPNINSIIGPLATETQLERTFLVNATNGSSYNWSTTSGTVNQQNNNAISIIWNTAGSATIQVIETNTFGCTDSASIEVLIEPLDVNESTERPAVLVYPNPTTGTLFIQHHEQNSIVKLVDVTGKIQDIPTEILTDRIELNLNRLTSGVYILLVEGEKTQRHLILKE